MLTRITQLFRQNLALRTTVLSYSFAIYNPPNQQPHSAKSPTAEQIDTLRKILNQASNRPKNLPNIKYQLEDTIIRVIKKLTTSKPEELSELLQTVDFKSPYVKLRKDLQHSLLTDCEKRFLDLCAESKSLGEINLMLRPLLSIKKQITNNQTLFSVVSSFKETVQTQQLEEFISIYADNYGHNNGITRQFLREFLESLQDRLPHTAPLYYKICKLQFDVNYPHFSAPAFQKNLYQSVKKNMSALSLEDKLLFFNSGPYVPIPDRDLLVSLFKEISEGLTKETPNLAKLEQFMIALDFLREVDKTLVLDEKTLRDNIIKLLEKLVPDNEYFWKVAMELLKLDVRIETKEPSAKDSASHKRLVDMLFDKTINNKNTLRRTLRIIEYLVYRQEKKVEAVIAKVAQSDMMPLQQVRLAICKRLINPKAPRSALDEAYQNYKKNDPFLVLECLNRSYLTQQNLPESLSIMRKCIKFDHRTPESMNKYATSLAISYKLPDLQLEWAEVVKQHRFFEEKMFVLALLNFMSVEYFDFSREHIRLITALLFGTSNQLSQAATNIFWTLKTLKFDEKLVTEDKLYSLSLLRLLSYEKSQLLSPQNSINFLRILAKLRQSLSHDIEYEYLVVSTYLDMQASKQPNETMDFFKCQTHLLMRKGVLSAKQALRFYNDLNREENSKFETFVQKLRLLNYLSEIKEHKAFASRQLEDLMQEARNSNNSMLLSLVNDTQTPPELSKEQLTEICSVAGIVIPNYSSYISSLIRLEGVTLQPKEFLNILASMHYHPRNTALINWAIDKFGELFETMSVSEKCRTLDYLSKWRVRIDDLLTSVLEVSHTLQITRSLYYLSFWEGPEFDSYLNRIHQNLRLAVELAGPAQYLTHLGDLLSLLAIKDELSESELVLCKDMISLILNRYHSTRISSPHPDTEPRLFIATEILSVKHPELTSICKRLELKSSTNKDAFVKYINRQQKSLPEEVIQQLQENKFKFGSTRKDKNSPATPLFYEKEGDAATHIIVVPKECHLVGKAGEVVGDYRLYKKYIENVLKQPVTLLLVNKDFQSNLGKLSS